MLTTRSFFIPCLLVAVLAAAPPAAGAGGRGITFDEPPDRFVVQRRPAADGASVDGDLGFAGDLRVTGSYLGEPASIEARVVTADAGDPVTGWTVVDGDPAGGAFGGTVAGVPAGGWYRLEVRWGDDPAVRKVGRNRFGVGVVVAALGQSNMVRMFTEDPADGSVEPPYATPDELTVRLGHGEPEGFGYARPPEAEIPVGWGDVTGSGGIRLANQLRQALGAPVLILDFAVDDVGLLDHWTDPDFAGWRRFAAAVETVGRIGVVLWHQGAYDAHRGVPSELYKTGLDRLHRRIAEVAGVAPGALPMVVAVQNRGAYDNAGPRLDAGYRAVRRAQLEWIAERPHAFAGGTTVDLELSSRPEAGDGHFWAAGYRLLADRLTHGALRALGVPGYPGVAGGRIAEATLDGKVVEVRIAHDQGTRLRLPDPGDPVEGFEVLGGGPGEPEVPLPIERAALADGGDAVLLTLGVVPRGAVRVRYLHGHNPFGGKATDAERRRPGNLLYDDFAYHPERRGVPVRSTPVDLVARQSGEVASAEPPADAPGAASLGADLLLHLPFDETAGTTAFDVAAGHHGEVAGPPDLGQPGVLGTAYRFDGKYDVVTVPDFDYPPAFSVSIWFRLADNSGDQYQYLYSQGRFGEASTLNVAVGEASNRELANRLVVNFRDGDDATGLFDHLLTVDVTGVGGGPELIDDRWHLVTFTAGPDDGAQLYVDGELRATLPSHGGDPFDPAGPVTVGTRSYDNAHRWLDGSLDDLRVYGRALTAEEVAALHRQGAGDR